MPATLLSNLRLIPHQWWIFLSLQMQMAIIEAMLCLQSYSLTVLQSHSLTVLQSYSLTVSQSHSLTVGPGVCRISGLLSSL